MVSQITKELDEYLNTRKNSKDKPKDKKKKSISYSKVPEMDNEYKTFVLDEEPKKSWFSRFKEWLLGYDEFNENLDDALDDVNDEINKVESELEEVELKEEIKVRNIFQKFFKKLRKIEEKEFKEEYKIDEEKIDDLMKYKLQINEDIRDALKIINKIIIKLPSEITLKVKESSDYEKLGALFKKYKVE